MGNVSWRRPQSSKRCTAPPPALIMPLLAIDHRRNLLALVRVDQKHDFIMPHCRLPLGEPPVASGEARSEAGQPAKKSAKDTRSGRSRSTSSAAGVPRTGQPPAATDTLRDSTRPAIGMRNQKITALPREAPHTAFPRRPAPAQAVASGPPRTGLQRLPVGTHHPDAAFLEDVEGPREVVTLATGTNSAAPAATLRTTPSTAAARSFGITTACAPPHPRCAGRLRGMRVGDAVENQQQRIPRHLT